MSSVAPSRQRAAHAIGIGDHRVGIRRDPLAVERRLHQPPLSQMRRAFAGQQPFAEQPLGALQRAALGEVAVVGDEDVLDVAAAG